MYSYQLVHALHAMATLQDPPPLQPVRCWEDLDTADQQLIATRYDRRRETTNSGDAKERKENRQRKAAELRVLEGWTWGLFRNNCIVQSVFDRGFTVTLVTAGVFCLCGPVGL